MSFKVEYDQDPHRKLDLNEEITVDRYKELRGKVPLVHLMTVALRQCTLKLGEVYAEQMKLKAEGIKRAYELSNGR